MKKLLCSAVLAALSLSAHADYSQHPRATELLHQLKTGFAFSDSDLNNVRSALTAAQKLPQLVQQEQKAPERVETWTQYSQRIDTSRIQDGAKLLQTHQSWFARAESEYGVPPAVIAGILGIETRYGRITGSVRVLDALATQGFDHPTRSPFFFSELTQFFVFCRDFGFKPASPKGSYAGAMGAAQFMPSNYRRLAVDFDGDGHRDLWTLPDAIGSIGHYLNEYDRKRAWQRGQPLVTRARINGAVDASIPLNPRAVTHTMGDLRKLGITGEAELPDNLAVALLDLTLDGGAHEYWLAFPNFFAVMSYNPRVYYAMAVTQLAQRIHDAHAQALGAPH